jgi:hypothetical protein
VPDQLALAVANPHRISVPPLLPSPSAGTPLVPVYVFGVSQLLHMVPASLWLERVSRLLRASLILFYGKFLLPIPFRVPLLFAVGAPIPVQRLPPGTRPTPEQVAELQGRLVAAMTALFDKYKGAYSPRWANKQLIIV